MGHLCLFILIKGRDLFVIDILSSKMCTLKFYNIGE